MIEAYAFLAMFAVQVLAMSVLHMVGLIKYVRTKFAELPDEYFVKVRPGVDRNLRIERSVTRYRTAQAVIAVFGLLLLGWLFSYMRRPDWDVSTVSWLSVSYFLLTFLPITLVALCALAPAYNKAIKSLPLDSKRKAVLQRRRLFDFVSPFAVSLAVAGYFLSVAFAIYVQSKPVWIGVLTLNHVLTAFYVYGELYGYARKWDPDATHASHVHMIGLGVRYSVYGCTAAVVFFSFAVAISTLDLDRWLPFGLSIFLVINALFGYMCFTTQPGKPEVDALSKESSAH